MKFRLNGPFKIEAGKVYYADNSCLRCFDFPYKGRVLVEKCFLEKLGDWYPCVILDSPTDGFRFSWVAGNKYNFRKDCFKRLI
jgi:hypothetical protein